MYKSNAEWTQVPVGCGTLLNGNGYVT